MQLDDPLASSSALEVPSTARGERLDAFLGRAASANGTSRSEWHRRIRAGQVLVNGQNPPPAHRLKGGETIAIAQSGATVSRLTPEHVPFEIVYADPAMLILEKPPGVVVHPAPGSLHGTIVQGLLARFPEMADAGESQRPGIVHRLDKDTSGLLNVGRTTSAVANLQRQFQNRQTEKHYIALVEGNLEEDDGEIHAPIGRDLKHRERMAVVSGGREALTRFTVLERFGQHTLVDVLLVTGRTHQIRVHFAAIQRCIAGDGTYGQGDTLPGLHRQFLHAASLRVRSPWDGVERTFTSELPADLAETLARLRGWAPHSVRTRLHS